ncbi:MAG TPA: hypothetical protein DEP23_01110 [Ruminococcaceae bacterium]|nr:hypothetical protein [Oscillospiraceae bacterium]
MAREWVLRGLSEDDLRPEPKAQPPKTPRGKIENYWYHYKWHTIAITATIVVLVILIGQLVTRDNPDYTIVLATQNYIIDTAKDKLETALEAYGRDIDGDGKVEVRIDSIALTNDAQLGGANQQKLVVHIASADIMFFIFQKEAFENNIRPLEKDGFKFFDKLGVQAEGIEGDGRYWNWSGSDLRKADEFSAMPEDLYFGVRSVSGTSDKKKSKEMSQQSLELLRAFLTKTPLTSKTN